MRAVKHVAVCRSDLVEKATCKLDNLFQQLCCHQQLQQGLWQQPISIISQRQHSYGQPCSAYTAFTSQPSNMGRAQIANAVTMYRGLRCIKYKQQFCKTQACQPDGDAQARKVLRQRCTFCLMVRATSRNSFSFPMVYEPNRNSVRFSLKASALTASNTKLSTCSSQLSDQLS